MNPHVYTILFSLVRGPSKLVHRVCRVSRLNLFCRSEEEGIEQGRRNAFASVDRGADRSECPSAMHREVEGRAEGVHRV
jgi:hypothetical protein